MDLNIYLRVKNLPIHLYPFHYQFIICNTLALRGAMYISKQDFTHTHTHTYIYIYIKEKMKEKKANMIMIVTAGVNFGQSAKVPL